MPFLSGRIQVCERNLQNPNQITGLIAAAEDRCAGTGPEPAQLIRCKLVHGAETLVFWQQICPVAAQSMVQLWCMRTILALNSEVTQMACEVQRDGAR